MFLLCNPFKARTKSMNPIWLIGFVAIWLAGCAPAEKMTSPIPAKTLPHQVVEGFSGKTAVDTGARAKAKIEAIKAQRQENIEEIPP